MNFYERVTMVCSQIPRGKTATYGQIALLCQKPKNARQVGYALGHHLTGEVPAHRVVNAKGYLSGAASFEMPGLQRMLLEKEGVTVRRGPEGDWVDLKEFGWKNTMEDALRLEKLFEESGV